jgi:hypothetical protein
MTVEKTLSLPGLMVSSFGEVDLEFFLGLLARPDDFFEEDGAD